jgi:glycosyltransferase involved in cell wall biosynthesis
MTATAQPFPVVLFTNSWAMGGMEDHVILLGRGLVQRGFSVAAICSAAESVRPLRQALADSGVDVQSPAERQTARLGGLSRLWALRRILRSYPGCVLHLHLGGPDAGDLAMLAGQLEGARAILRSEHVPPVGRAGWLKRWRIRTRDRFISLVIHTSEQSHREHLEKLGRDPRKCVMIPLAVDVQRFQPDSTTDGAHVEFGLPAGSPIVGTVARLGEERKGIATFLEMASMVVHTLPTASFLVVGDGPMQPQLERCAEELGIAERVVFTGARKDVPRLLAAMDVFVLPSTFEGGGPLTLVEALSMGRAVVSTPVGDAPLLVEDGVSGRIAPIGDAASMAAAVVGLLEDRQLAKQLGERGRRAAMARVTVDSMVDQIVQAYQRAV